MDSQRQAEHDAERGFLRQGGRNLPKAVIHYVDLHNHKNPIKKSLYQKEGRRN